LDISLITSLYRADAHLETYGQQVLAVAAQVHEAGLSLEVVIVANEASETERRLIEALAVQAEAAGTVRILPLHIPRETLYASWNRGVQASSGAIIGFWNVDDGRTSEALIEGQRLIAEGCELVDFPIDHRLKRHGFGLFSTWQRTRFPAMYDPEVLGWRKRLGPFFLFSRDLYERAGSFDEDFRISGDFEWGERETTRTARFCAGSHVGGTFIIHGDNLSGGHSHLQTVEDNIVFLRHGAWEMIRPAEPELMRSVWEQWGHQGITLPEAVEHQLLGAEAIPNWEGWLQRRQRHDRSETLRALPRFVIDQAGLRPLLARLGIVKRAHVRR
jgi:hypothetical protein